MSDVAVPLLNADAAVQTRRMPRLTAARVAVGLILLATWAVAAEAVPDLIAGPWPTALRVATLVATGEIMPMVLTTGGETLGGLLLGAGFGVVFPFLIQASPRLSAVVEPFARAAVGIPKLALSPVLILWFGIALLSKVVLVALMTFFLVFVATFAGVRSVGPSLVNTAAIFGAGRLEIAREVYWHAAQPFVWAALRAAVPWAINAALVGEFLASEQGVGFYIHHSYDQADITGAYTGVVITAAMVLGADFLLSAVQRRALQWRPVDVGTLLH